MTEVFGELLEGSLPPFARGSSQEEIIRLSITGLVDTLIRVWPVFKALGRVASLDPELLTLRDVLLHRRVEELAQRIIRMERAGYGQIADPYLVSLALASMTDEMARRWVIYQGQISREDFIEVLVAIFEMTLLGQRNERAAVGPVHPLVIKPQG
jgi:hypothetical protein